jgi:hypothetical protein
MMKGKFGDSFRSKSDVEQINEALCKVLCHNTCVLAQASDESGIELAFSGWFATSSLVSSHRNCSYLATS